LAACQGRRPDGRLGRRLIVLGTVGLLGVLVLAVVASLRSGSRTEPPLAQNDAPPLADSASPGQPPPAPVPGPVLANSAPLLFTERDGCSVLVVLSADGSVWTQRRDPQGTADAWALLATDVKDVQGETDDMGRLHLFLLSTARRISVAVRSPAGSSV